MKKALLLLTVAILSTTLFFGCTAEETPPTDITSEDMSGQSVSIFRGIIEEINEDSAIVVPNQDQEHILSSGDKVGVNLTEYGDFVAGDEVVVYYTGEIMESYPLQINVTDITLASEFDSDSEDDISDIEAEELKPIQGKVAVNIEGVVTSVDGNSITLDDGTIVLINDQTLFETENVGNFTSVNEEILVGNYIQGYTLDDVQNNEVTASNISLNEGLTAPAASAIVNIEGTITEVSNDGTRLTLDNGKIVVITEQTEMGIGGPNAAPIEKQFFEPTFRVGNLISGFTEDDSTEEIIAYAIYNNWNWENPIDQPQIIETEVIINVTKEYDGTINNELKSLGVVSVDNIFDLGDTIMYLLVLSAPIDDIISQLEALP